MRLEFHSQFEAEQDGDGWSVMGRAVPFDTVCDDQRRVMFAKGSLTAEQFIKRPIRFGHSQPIGAITEASVSDDGVHVVGRIADTSVGRDTLALMKVLNPIGMSVSIDSPVSDYDNDTATTTITAVGQVREVSITDVPAFTQTAATSFEQETHMSNTTTTARPADTDVAEVTGQLRDELLELRDQFAALQRPPEPAGPSDPFGRWSSIGEFAKAVRSGDPEARNMTEFALLQNSTADAPGLFTEWRAAFIDSVGLGRPIVSAAGTVALQDGDPVFVRNNWDATDGVDVQANEYDAVYSVKSSITKESADIFTMAGGSTNSIQLIERSDPQFVSILMNDMGKSYSAACEIAFIKALEANGTGTQGGALSTADAGNVWKFIRQANVKVQDATQADATYAVVSKALWDELIVAADGDERPLYSTVGPTNAPDTGGLRTGAMVIDGVRVYRDVYGALTTAAAIVSNGAAAQFAEDGPRFMSSDFPSDLSREYAIYGYGAHFLYRPAGVVKVTLA